MRNILQNYFKIAEPKTEAQHKRKSPSPSEVNLFAYLSHQVTDMRKLCKETPRSYKNITKTTADIT